MSLSYGAANAAQLASVGDLIGSRMTRCAGLRPGRSILTRGGRVFLGRLGDESHIEGYVRSLCSIWTEAMIRIRAICRTCRTIARFDLDETAKHQAWWMKHDGHERELTRTRIRAGAQPLPTGRSFGVLAFCQRCISGDYLKDFDKEYDAWSARHRTCKL